MTTERVLGIPAEWKMPTPRLERIDPEPQSSPATPNEGEAPMSLIGTPRLETETLPPVPPTELPWFERAGLHTRTHEDGTTCITHPKSGRRYVLRATAHREFLAKHDDGNNAVVLHCPFIHPEDFED